MRYILIVFLVILASCSSNNNNKESVDSKLIKVMENRQDTKDVDLYLDGIKFIDLKTEDTFFGEISKMKIFKGKIYILDENKRLGLYVYDLSGDLIYEYRNKGQAPGQYLQLTDFIVNDDESVELLDSYLQKIFLINNKGEHQQTKKMSFPASDFIKYKDHYFFHTNNLEISKGEEQKGLLVKSNLDLTDSENLVPIDTARGEFILNQRGENFFYWNENAYFMDIFSNEAISLTSSNPNLKFDFDKKSFPEDFFSKNNFPDQGLYLNHIFSNELAWNLTGYYGFDDLLFFKYALGMDEYFGFYNKAKNSIAINPRGSWKSNNPCFSFLSIPVAAYGNKLVFSLNSNQVAKLKSKGCSELEGLDVDENNILMLMEIK
ncbi:MAG: 6-bladed beta-propeller [Bacteroidota bacterium]